MVKDEFLTDKKSESGGYDCNWGLHAVNNWALVWLCLVYNFFG